MKINLSILVVSVGLLSITVLPQVRTITQADLWKATFEANKVSEKIFPRRVVAEERTFDNGTLKSSRVITSEYDKAGNEHVVDIYKNGETTATREMIRIGKVYYCRDDKTAWKRSTDFCGDMRLSAPPNIVTSKITVEDAILDREEVTHYSSYVTHRGWGGSPQTDSEPLRFIEQDFWVNKNGSSNRWDQAMGLVKPKTVTKTNYTGYTYGVKISAIMPPIK